MTAIRQPQRCGGAQSRAGRVVGALPGAIGVTPFGQSRSVSIRAGTRAVDREGLSLLRDEHAGWRLLRYEHASLVVALFHRVFISPNVRSVSQADLVEALDDELFAHRRSKGESAPAKGAAEYLVEWTTADRGWLRRFFPDGSDQPAFDLTPDAEQAVLWVLRIADRPFVATESRLRVLVELLDRMARGIESDPDARVAALTRQRNEIEAEIARVRGGDLDVTDPRQLREQFQQFVAMARELLGDFRQVEQNFRTLDRDVREQIATWLGGKGDLIAEILGERDAIDASDEGRSFRAFWELLVSQQRQEEMTDHLERVLQHPAVAELQPDRRLRRVHHDWLEAGEHTQRTVALLSSQLRRFLDDRVWLEDRRIVDILRRVEANALAVREQPPAAAVHSVDLPRANVALPFERPLFTPRSVPLLDDEVEQGDNADVALDSLFDLQVVDVARITEHIDRTLSERGQVTLRDLCESMPIERGLAEIVTYLHLGSDRYTTTTDELVEDTITWERDGHHQSARLPRVVFVR